MKKKRPKKKYMYGKFHHDLFEFRIELHNLVNRYNVKFAGGMLGQNDLINLRNEVVALLKSWVASKKFESKFGIKLPLHSKPPSVEKFLEKQGRSFHNIYEPCEICGEDRITHYCHIIPKCNGGPDHEENYISLCPTHHHLFDHSRLNKSEWEKIDLQKKMGAAHEYAVKVILPKQKKFWETR